MQSLDNVFNHSTDIVELHLDQSNGKVVYPIEGKWQAHNSLNDLRKTQNMAYTKVNDELLLLTINIQSSFSYCIK